MSIKSKQLHLNRKFDQIRQMEEAGELKNRKSGNRALRKLLNKMCIRDRYIPAFSIIIIIQQYLCVSYHHYWQKSIKIKTFFYLMFVLKIFFIRAMIKTVKNPKISKKYKRGYLIWIIQYWNESEVV